MRRTFTKVQPEQQRLCRTVTIGHVMLTIRAFSLGSQPRHSTVPWPQRRLPSGSSMLQAIGSLLSKTIDAYLHLSSPEVRQRKIGRQVFELYSCLDDVEACMTATRDVVLAIADTKEKAPILQLYHNQRLLDLADIRALALTGEMDLIALSLDEKGVEHATEYRGVLQRDFMPAALSAQIRVLNRAIGKSSNLMQAEAWELLNRPELLKRLDVFQPGLSRIILHAWISDGGFVEVLLRLGLHQDIDGRVLRLLDKRFDPRSHLHGYEIEPDEATYDLTNQSQVDELVQIIDSSRVAVGAARGAVRTFIAEKFSLSDIL